MLLNFSQMHREEYWDLAVVNSNTSLQPVLKKVYYNKSIVSIFLESINSFTVQKGSGAYNISIYVLLYLFKFHWATINSFGYENVWSD